MTIEEAKRILHPNTSREAIAEIDYHNGFNREKGVETVMEACRVACSVMTAFEQFKWERDMAIATLEEIGLGLGSKTDHIREVLDKFKWIPCSERLPENGNAKYYLVCHNDGILGTLHYYEGWNCSGLPNGEVHRRYEMHDVIAWMELPEPYKEGEQK